VNRFDVCNGDADGLCAVVQWRLAHPAPATLITGLKRDIELLQQVQAAPGDEVLVCDLSMQRNLPALQRVLQQGARVRWFDHHVAQDVPQHLGLQAHLDFDARVCSSLLVDRFLGGRFREWALVGAYGDNLTAVADALAVQGGLDEAARRQLRLLGEAINYNAYGDEPGDSLIVPQDLYALMQRHAQPLQMLREEPIAAELDARRRADMLQAQAQPLHKAGAHARWLRLPDAPWSRRVVGTLANALASAEPALAHAVLRDDGRGGHVVSLRAPLRMPGGADVLCRRFGGGGRAGAAGIDHLSEADRDSFIAALTAARWGG
jgi:hypothetical protein